jgi:hypothetical protein
MRRNGGTGLQPCRRAGPAFWTRRGV